MSNSGYYMRKIGTITTKIRSLVPLCIHKCRPGTGEGQEREAPFMKTVPATITLAAALVAAIATPIAASPARAKLSVSKLGGTAERLQRPIYLSARRPSALAQSGVGRWAKYRYPNLAGPPNGYNVPYIYPPDRRPHSPNPAWDVYSTRGRYIGSDPDPFIRGQLARDPAQHD
jgi:hypothetical protein